MITFIQHKRTSLTYRLFSAFIAFTFAFGIVLPPQMSYAQVVPATILNLPVPGTMLPVSTGYTPALITGITIHPENPLEFDFMVDTGDSGLTGDQLEEESQKLIKYFLASLTVPEDELWVNLSPYEGDRIVPHAFGETEMGRDLLAQDYLLKQLTASLMYPEDELGKKFWDRVYKKADELYGTTEIPMNTFNKVWIVPDEALVFEKDSNAYVIDSHLKVMLEEDYVALKNNMDNSKFSLDQVVEDDAEVISGVTSDVVREVLIPEIEKEVNEGKTFANLRQIYNSMILAAWYKKNLKESLLGQVYVDQKKTKGVDVKDKQVKQKIYNQYLEAFKKGVYNYIREDYDPVSQEIIPRKYFSGGYYGTQIDRVLKEFNMGNLDSIKNNPRRFVSFVKELDGISSEEYRKTIRPIFFAYSRQERADILDQLSKEREDNTVSVTAELVENADEEDSEGIHVVTPTEVASSPMGIASEMEDLARRDPKGHYRRLDVFPDASMEEINMAFGRKSELAHARFTGSKESLEDWRSINDAYKVLSHAETRKAYDPQWNEGKASSPVEIKETAKRVEVPPGAPKIEIGTNGAREEMYSINQQGERIPGPFDHNFVARMVTGVTKKALEMVENGDLKLKNPDKGLRMLVAYDARSNADKYAVTAYKAIGAYKNVEVAMVDGITDSPDAAAMSESAYDFVIQITASHNPENWGGVKIFSDGMVAPDFITKPMEAEANSDEGRSGYWQERYDPSSLPVLAFHEGLEQKEDAFPDIEKFVELYKEVNPDATMVVDLMGGAASRYAGLFESIGIEVLREEPMSEVQYKSRSEEELYAPNPTIKANFESDFDEFLENAADGSIYFALDGDVDRLVVWAKDNGKAVEINPNNLGMLYLDYLLSNKERLGENLEGKTLVVGRTLPTTRGLDKLVEKYGLKDIVVVPVGSKNFRDIFLNPDYIVVVATEESGHQIITVGGQTFFDSAVAQMLLVLEMMGVKQVNPYEMFQDLRQRADFHLEFANDPITLTDELADKFVKTMETNPQEIIDIVESEVGLKAHAKYVITKDNTVETYEAGKDRLNPVQGIYFHFKNGVKESWLYFRKSGTEPKIRIYRESGSHEYNKELFEIGLKAIGASSPVLQAEVKAVDIIAEALDVSTDYVSENMDKGLGEFSYNGYSLTYIQNKFKEAFGLDDVTARRIVHTTSPSEIVSWVREQAAASAPVDQEVMAKMKRQLSHFRQKLGMSDVDIGYFSALFKKYLTEKEDLRIAEDSFIPSAYLSSEEQREKMAVTPDKDIEADSRNSEAAKEVTLRVVQMKGGIGSSFKRKRTLLRLKGSDSLADKATDSYFEKAKVRGYDSEGNPIIVLEDVSVAELKARRMIHLQEGEEKTYKKVIIEEMVNEESKPHVENFYNDTVYVLDRVDARRTKKRTYKEVIGQTEGLELADEMIVQGSYPNIDVETNGLIDDDAALSPGGHGFLGTLTLNRIAENAPAEGEHVITSIVNGDGVNNFTTEAIAGWMYRNNIPIVIITTTRTPLDIKGGALGLERVKGGAVDTAIQIFEKAQAERVGQFEEEDGSPGLFQKLGITEGEPGGQIFNTNISNYNENVLHPFLKRLREIIGEEKFYEIITPDLITNAKNKEINGKTKKVFQLEGAKASALLNLNRFVTTTTDAEVRALMTEFGLTKLVHIVNLSPEERIDSFTPSKYSYDHALYGRSTSFNVNVFEGKLELAEGVNPAELPSFDVDAFLEDLENDYEAFGEEFDVKGLKSLRTRGEIVFPNSVLKGNLSIENLSGQRANLNDHKDLFETTTDGRLVLDNVRVTIAADGTIKTEDYFASSPVRKVELQAVSSSKVSKDTYIADILLRINEDGNILNVEVTVRDAARGSVLTERFSPASGRGDFITEEEATSQVRDIMNAALKRPEFLRLRTPKDRLDFISNEIDKALKQRTKEEVEKAKELDLTIRRLNKQVEEQLETIKDHLNDGTEMELQTSLQELFDFLKREEAPETVASFAVGKLEALSDEMTEEAKRVKLKNFLTLEEFIADISTHFKLDKVSVPQRAAKPASSPVTAEKLIEEDLTLEEIASLTLENAIDAKSRRNAEEMINSFRENPPQVVGGLEGQKGLVDKIAKIYLLEKVAYFLSFKWSPSGSQYDNLDTITTYAGEAIDILLKQLEATSEFQSLTPVSPKSPDIKNGVIVTIQGNEGVNLFDGKLPEWVVEREHQPKIIAVAASSPVGGIDLNPELLDLQIKRDGNGIPLPIGQQPIYNMKIDGFFPVIINITPITASPLLLGLFDEEPEDALSFNQGLSPVDQNRMSEYVIKLDEQDITV